MVNTHPMFRFKLAGMKTFFLIILISFSASIHAQDKEKITGKWKIAAMSDEDMYYDVIKDSLHFNNTKPEGMSSETAEAAIKASKQMLAEFLKEGYFTFNQDMSFVGYFLQTEKKGTFSIDETNKTIMLKAKDKSDSAERKDSKLQYSFRDKRLLLKVTEGNDEEGFNLELEKL